jgi:hypothetical protein
MTKKKQSTEAAVREIRRRTRRCNSSSKAGQSGVLGEL